jgi:hypothetical protein
MTGEKRTPADGRYTAVLDRFEERDPARSGGSRDGGVGDGEDGRELAVLLLESGDEVVAERAIPTWRLPEDARRQDAVLAVTLKNGFVTSMSYDSKATEERVGSAQSRFDRLAERPDESESGK